MILEAQILEQEPGADQRGSPRRKSGALLTIAAPNQGVSALILDLSLTGMKVQSDARFEVNDVLKVQIPGYPAAPAKIVWKKGNQFGCEFKTPISKAAMSAFILRSPVSRSGSLNNDSLTEVRLGEATDLDAIAERIRQFWNENGNDARQLLGFRLDEDSILIAIIGDAD